MLLFNMNTRQRQLLDQLRRQKKVLIDEEASRYGVSTMTIRRDLRQFAKQNKAVLIQGGAIMKSDQHNELPFFPQSTYSQRAIAKETISYIQANHVGTLMLSVGSTTLEIARQIAQAELALTVITTSLPAATILYQTKAQVILPGGAMRQNSMDLVGPITEKNLGEFHIDLLISGCDAADSTSGFFTGDLNQASAEQKCVEISEKVVIATESYKFSKRSFVKFANLEDVSTIITDNQLNSKDMTNLSEHNLELILV